MAALFVDQRRTEYALSSGEEKEGNFSFVATDLAAYVSH